MEKKNSLKNIDDSYDDFEIIDIAGASKEIDVRSEGLSSNVIIDETGDDRAGNDDAEIIEGNSKMVEVLPEIKSLIFLLDPDTNSWRTATVLSRAGKAHGRNRYLFNIKDNETGALKSMNLKEIKFSINESGGTFFVGFIIEYLEKLNAIILIIYSSRPFNVVCEHQVFALRGSD